MICSRVYTKHVQRAVYSKRNGGRVSGVNGEREVTRGGRRSGSLVTYAGGVGCVPALGVVIGLKMRCDLLCVQSV